MNEVIACDECDYYHTVANGCPTQEMIDANYAGYDGTYEEQDEI
jgi:hypothetical protein